MNKIIAFLAMAITLIACEKNPTIDYEMPDINPTKVYQIIEDNIELNIYKHKPLVIHTVGSAATKEVILEREEASEEAPFDFAFISEEEKDERIIREIEVEDADGNLVMQETIIEAVAIYTFNYEVIGNEESKIGEAVITTTKVELVGKNIQYQEVLEPNTTRTIRGEMSIKEVLN